MSHPTLYMDFVAQQYYVATQGDGQASIQQSVYEALVEFMPLRWLMGSEDQDTRVYDDVPQGASFPYIVIGEDTSIPFDDDCNVGAESTITIHVWSVYSGRLEVKQIMNAVYNRLHRQNLSITGSYSITLNAEYQDSFLDPDGVTRHGVIRFRLLTRSN